MERPLLGRHQAEQPGNHLPSMTHSESVRGLLDRVDQPGYGQWVGGALSAGLGGSRRPARTGPSCGVLGLPLCLDCDDHDGQVGWNAHVGELWRRTVIGPRRELARVARARGTTARLSYERP